VLNHKFSGILIEAIGATTRDCPYNRTRRGNPGRMPKIPVYYVLQYLDKYFGPNLTGFYRKFELIKLNFAKQRCEKVFARKNGFK
ncbi:MAG: hypothetical protein DRR00_25220, partial [Candidatus Parabeggiatoa sp. nov. 3]